VCLFGLKASSSVLDSRREGTDRVCGSNRRLGQYIPKNKSLSLNAENISAADWWWVWHVWVD